MPQLYLILTKIFIEIAVSCQKFYVYTCFNKADRQGIQLRSVKSIFLQIELRYLYEILYDDF